MLTRLWHICPVMLVAAPVVVYAQSGSVDMRALVEQALNEPSPIAITDTTLGEAIMLLQEQTGIKMVISPEVMNLAPRGARTPLDEVDIRGIPVREGLRVIFSRVGMTFEVRDGYVEIVPKKPVRDLGRTPTWRELDVLGTLWNMQPGVDAEALASLESSVRFKVDAPDPWDSLSGTVRKIGAGPGDEVLTQACDRLGWAWSLADGHIVVTSKNREIWRRLGTRVSLRVRSRSLHDLFGILGERINVDIRAEPGLLASLPPSLQLVTMTVSDSPAEEVLNTIAANTGLGYFIESEGVLFYDPTRTTAGVSAAGATGYAVSSSDPYVAKMVIPLENGNSLEWLIRRSELPEDLQEMRKHDLRGLFDLVRRRKAGPTP